jgi:hypothetical protein
LARAVAAIVKAERGEIHLSADDPSWLDELVTELAAFTDCNDVHDDQGDRLPCLRRHRGEQLPADERGQHADRFGARKGRPMHSRALAAQ